jgi:hypothetical protein
VVLSADTAHGVAGTGQLRTPLRRFAALRECVSMRLVPRRIVSSAVTVGRSTVVGQVALAVDASSGHVRLNGCRRPNLPVRRPRPRDRDHTVWHCDDRRGTTWSAVVLITNPEC